MINKKNGFTLVEMLIVIGIIGLLATIVTAGSFYARSYAKKTKAQADVATIAKAIETLAMDTRQWPGHATPYVVCSGACDNNELEDLSANSAGLSGTDGNYPDWSGHYIQALTVDPWGKHYFFDSDYVINGETKAVVGSYGPNGRGLNEYDSDDIIQIISR